MILTDREIQIALQNEAIIVDPAPDISFYSSTSLDLTLDRRLTLFKDQKTGINLSIDPSQKGYNHEEVMAEITTPVDIDEEHGFEFLPHRFELFVGSPSAQSELLEPARKLDVAADGLPRLVDTEADQRDLQAVAEEA
ncbi:hypothetical protein LCM4576_31725 [Mesorhizobium sp. LCM 4576]|nr:hypothetical protein LCM4576_31725 [Mesorhizobium sp. LCM 4576]